MVLELYGHKSWWRTPKPWRRTGSLTLFSLGNHWWGTPTPLLAGSLTLFSLVNHFEFEFYGKLVRPSCSITLDQYNSPKWSITFPLPKCCKMLSKIRLIFEYTFITAYAVDVFPGFFGVFQEYFAQGAQLDIYMSYGWVNRKPFETVSSTVVSCFPVVFRCFPLQLIN
jgi:hypothetical protein